MAAAGDLARAEHHVARPVDRLVEQAVVLGVAGLGELHVVDDHAGARVLEDLDRRRVAAAQERPAVPRPLAESAGVDRDDGHALRGGLRPADVEARIHRLELQPVEHPFFVSKHAKPRRQDRSDSHQGQARALPARPHLPNVPASSPGRVTTWVSPERGTSCLC